MNGRQAAFMIHESDRRRAKIDCLPLEERFAAIMDPTYERWLLDCAERLDWPWKRLWHRIKKPDWMRE